VSDDGCLGDGDDNVSIGSAVPSHWLVAVWLATSPAWAFSQENLRGGADTSAFTDPDNQVKILLFSPFKFFVVHRSAKLLKCVGQAERIVS
jgi:hypothetical protein